MPIRTACYNRIAKVQIPPVTGAPGDGNESLTKQMRTHLAALGPVVQDDPNGADFIVQGNVRMVPIAGGQQRVEIQWVVKDAERRRAGQGRAAQRHSGRFAQPLLGRRRGGGGHRGRGRREGRHHPPVRTGAAAQPVMDRGKSRW